MVCNGTRHYLKKKRLIPVMQKGCTIRRQRREGDDRNFLEV